MVYRMIMYWLNCAGNADYIEGCRFAVVFGRVWAVPCPGVYIARCRTEPVLFDIIMALV